MSKVLRPVLPFQVAIPGGIYDGKKIEIKGNIPFGAYRTRIDLNDGYDSGSDPVLHLGIRFDERCVVRNHQFRGRWGPEERTGPFPFQPGKEFTIAIVVEETKYSISVNNKHCWDFNHRLPIERVKSFAMYGSADVYEIEFIDKSSPITPAIDTFLPPISNRAKL